MLRAGSALVSDPDPGRAAARAAAEALVAAGAERADAALLFATGSIDLSCAAAGAREALGSCAIAAATGHAVAAGDREEDDAPAVVVLALAGAEAASFAVTGEAGAQDAIELEIEALLGRSPRETDLVVVFADPFGIEAAPLAGALGALAPATVVGVGAGLEGVGAARVATGERAAPGGASGLVLSLAAPARVASSQGCRPVTEPFVVTRASGHWVLELSGKPALDVYREVVGEPLAEDLRRASESVLAAIPRGAQRRGDPGDAWLARRLAGFAPERRAFALPASLRVGTPLRFALRSADLAREDLARALAALGPARAGLHLGASDRGRALFGHAGLESALVARALAPAAVASLFGSFEIASLAGSLEPLAHATVLVALS